MLTSPHRDETALSITYTTRKGTCMASHPFVNLSGVHRLTTTIDRATHNNEYEGLGSKYMLDSLWKGRHRGWVVAMITGRHVDGFLLLAYEHTKKMRWGS